MNPVPLFLLAITLPLLLGGCGEKTTVEPNLTYEVKGDAVTITGYSKMPVGELIIPATIKGKPVTSIKGWAFVVCNNVTSITIPDSVTSIGERAFQECSNLTSVTIGNGLLSIEQSAFSYCHKLTSIIIPDSVTSIAEYAFDYCSGLARVTIGKNINNIKSSVFQRCNSLSAIIFQGDAPNAYGNFSSKNDNLTIYRKPEAKGWGDTFAGRPVKLISEKP